MKKTIFSGILLLTVVLLLTGLLSCSIKNAIIGSWQDTSGNTMQFFRDGTYTSGGLLPTNGTYSFPDKSHVKIEFTGLLSIAGAQIYECKIDGNKLVLTDSFGTATEYTKSK